MVKISRKVMNSITSATVRIPFIALITLLLSTSLLVVSVDEIHAQRTFGNETEPASNEPASSSGFNDPFTESDQTSNLRIPDPFEPINRATFWFNDKAFIYGLRPLARGWYYVVPTVGRQGVRNFFKNIDAPNSFVNSLLQADPVGASKTTGRFVINSTVGIGGLFDPASYLMDPVNEDFDKTFSTWGIGTGPYVMLPVLGPSTARGSVAMVFDSVFYPPNYLDGDDAGLAITGLSVTRNVNTVSFNLGEYEDLKSGAVDPYSAFKDVYEQRLQQGKGLFD